MAVVLTFAVGGSMERAPLIFFFPAVVVASWYGGGGPGLTAAVLSLLAAQFFFFPPAASLSVGGDDLLALATFGVVVGVISLLTGRLRDMRGRAEQAEKDVRELPAVMRARVAAETAAQRLAFLAEASAELGASFDYAETMQKVARLAVPLLGDCVTVHVVEANGSNRRMVLESADPAQRDLTRELQECYPFSHEAGEFGVARAIRTGATQLAAEVQDSEPVASAEDEETLLRLREPRLRSYVTAPMTAGGRILGTLTCGYTAPGRSYAPADVKFIEELAHRAGAAIHNALLMRELEGQRRKLELQATELLNREARLERTLEKLEITTAALRRSNEALMAQSREAERARAEAGHAAARLNEVARITQAVLRHETLEAVLHEILDQVQGVLGTTEATILLLDESGQRLRPRAARGLNEDLVRSLEIPLGMGMAGRVAAERQPLVIPDASASEIINPFLRERVRSLLAVPLLVDQIAIGVLHVGSSTRREFSDDDRTFLQMVADWVASTIDRTRLFEAERDARAEAQAARREAEAANRAKGDFVAALSHDLRTPLTAIVGYTQLLELGLHGPVTEQQADDLKRIHSSTQYLVSLLDRLLSYARLEAGRARYDLCDIPLDGALRDLESMVAPQLTHRQIEYVYRPCPAALVVRADREAVIQVVLNLLANAIKFTEPGGCITLEAEPERQRVAIRVHDTGRGISPTELASIFEPFMQAGDVAGQGGFGLGLAISRQIARAMDGDLVAESVAGAGSTFTFTLARVQVDARRVGLESS